MSREPSEPPSPSGTNPYPPADARRRSLARLVDVVACLSPLLLAPPAHRFPAALAATALVLMSDGLFGPGRSLGKRLFGLRTLSLRTHRPAPLTASIQRNSVFALGLLPAFVSTDPLVFVIESLGALLALEALIALQPLRRDLGQRRFGNLLAGTQVIDASIALYLVDAERPREGRPAAAGARKHPRLLPPSATPRGPACASP